MYKVCNLLTVYIIFFSLCLAEYLCFYIHVKIEIDLFSADVEVLTFICHSFADALLFIR